MGVQILCGTPCANAPNDAVDAAEDGVVGDPVREDGRVVQAPLRLRTLGQRQLPVHTMQELVDELRRGYGGHEGLVWPWMRTELVTGRRPSAMQNIVYSRYYTPTIHAPMHT